MRSERETIRRIRRAVADGKITEPFRTKTLNVALGINWAGVFLAKHCVGTGSSTGLFVRMERGLYRLQQLGQM